MQNDRWKRLNTLFDQAVLLEPQERSNFLRSACVDDAELAAELQQLLANDESDARLTRAVSEVAADVIPQQSSAGEELGAYTLVRNIGAGGMGTIWLARRSDDSYDAEVAIKLMHGIASDSQRERFFAERQILATLNHPNIARLLDGGSTSTGVPYVVMEYVQGERIDRYCNSRNVSVDNRLKLFCDLCKAVQYAHRNLVVHRDLKPANILVTDDGTAKLLDFGIAKLTGSIDDRLLATRETVDGSSMLTPVYASPEQIRGDAINTASDVYSLGVVLFELLTGHLPYQVNLRDPIALAKAICEDDCALASTRLLSDNESPINGATPRQLARQLAGDIDNILAKALAKNPEERYASAEDFAADVQRHIARIPVRARPATRRYRLQRFIERNRLSVATTALLVAALTAATLYSVQQTRSAIAANAVAERERDLTRSEVLRSTLASADSLINDADPATAKRLLENIRADDRGWEWHYLRNLLDQSDATTPGGNAIAMSLLEHGTVLTVSKNGQVQWRRSSTVIAEAQLATQEIVALTGPLAVLVKNRHVEIWTLATPGQPQLLSRHALQDTPLSVALSDNGAHLAVAYSDRVVTIDTASDEQHEWPLSAPAAELSIDNSGEQVLVRFQPGHDEFHRLFDANGNTLGASPANGMSAVAMSADGKYLATAESPGTIRLREAHTSRVLTRFLGHREPPSVLRFSANGRWLYSTSNDRTVRAWPIESGESPVVLLSLDSAPLMLAANSSGQLVAAMAVDGILQTWRRAVSSARQQFTGVWATFIRNGNTIASQDAFGSLRLIDTASAQVFDQTATGNLRPTAFAGSGKTANIVVADQNLLFFVDTETLAQSQPFDLEATITDLALADTGQLLAAVTSSGEVFVLRPEGTTWVESHRIESADTNDVSFSTDASLLGIASASGIRLHAAETGALLQQLELPGLEAESLTFTASNNAIASGWSDGAVRILDSQGLQPGATMVANVGAVTALTFSHDGERLASGDANGGVWISNVDSGRPLFRLDTGTDNVIRHVEFSADSQQLIASGDANLLVLWSASPDRERRNAAQQLHASRTAISRWVEDAVLSNPNIEELATYIRSETSLTPLEKKAALQISLAPPSPPLELAKDPFDGYAIDIRGGDEHILVSNPESLRMRKQFTIEAWIEPASFDGATTPLTLRMLFNKEGEYQIAINPDGRLSWTIATDLGWLGWVDTRYSAPHGEWSHVALVRNRGEVEFYLNGRLVQQQSVPDSIGDQHPYKNEFRIGGRQHTPSSFVGRIDNMRVWSVARNENQIQSTMQAMLRGDESGLLAAWNFDGSPGDATVRDLTGNHPGRIVDTRRSATHRLSSQP